MSFIKTYCDCKSQEEQTAIKNVLTKLGYKVVSYNRNMWDLFPMISIDENGFQNSIAMNLEGVGYTKISAQTILDTKFDL